jgi:hypothetical protein
VSILVRWATAVSSVTHSITGLVLIWSLLLVFAMGLLTLAVVAVRERPLIIFRFEGIIVPRGEAIFVHWRLLIGVFYDTRGSGIVLGFLVLAR